MQHVYGTRTSVPPQVKSSSAYQRREALAREVKELMIQDQTDRANRAIEALGMGEDGTSQRRVTFVPSTLRRNNGYTYDVFVYKAQDREGRAEDLTFAVSTETPSVGGNEARGCVLHCRVCDDGSKPLAWCNHLGEIVLNGYDAVPLNANPGLMIQVPLTPSMGIWKRVDLEPLKYGEDDPSVENDNGLYPYEAYLRRGMSNRKYDKTYIGMFNEFDGLKQLRTLVFDWTRTCDVTRDKVFYTCKSCKQTVTHANTQDRMLIALEGACGKCLAHVLEDARKKAEAHARNSDFLKSAIFQYPDLVPDI